MEPGPEPALTAPRCPRRWPWLLALLAIALPLLLYRLGAKDFWEASEGRPAQSAREMAARGDWLVQYTNGELDLTKPPLYAWLTGLAFHLFGESEGAARLPSVLATLGILAVTFLLGARMAGPRAGFLAGLVLLTQARFLWQARLAELETLLALGVVAAYAALGSALERPAGRERTARFAAGWVALGFAFAVKGPIAWLLVLPGLIGVAWWTKRWRALVSPAALFTFPLALVVGLAWYAAVVRRDPSALDTFLSYGKGENVGHLRDPFYYLWQYPLAVLPWTPLVLFGFFLPRAPDLDPVTRGRARFCVAAFGATFLALSILHQKQTHYLIPVFPFAAVLAGATLERAGAAKRTLWRAAFVGVIVLEGFVAGHLVPKRNAAHSPRAFLERVAARVPRDAPLASAILGSHSEHLWYLGRTVVVTPDEAALRRWFEQPGERYALAFDAQAWTLVGLARRLDEDTKFQKKDRHVVLLVDRPPQAGEER